jgi:hypothetical protein
MADTANRRLGIVAVLALASAPLNAQSVRGTTVDQSGVAVAGVVVMLVDASNQPVARSLTDGAGEFRIQSRGPGSFRLRTMRVGFRPMTSEPFVLEIAQEVARRLVLTNVPFSLDTVRVAGRNPCRAPSDSAAGVFAIWEQVRTALDAVQLTTSNRTIGATLIAYERTLEPNRERVTHTASRTHSGLTRGAWKAVPVEQLRRTGYVVTADDGSTTYYAPDINVLVSNAFAEDHCFRLRSSDDAGAIGLGFEPTRERQGIAGITGTLWLDRKSSELRRLEFRYVNAPREQLFGNAGGQMEFARMRDGAWVITRWHIRMPVLEPKEVRAGSSRMTNTELHVREIRVEGADLVLVTRTADTLWMQPPAQAAPAKVDSAPAFFGKVLSEINAAPIGEVEVAIPAHSSCIPRLRLT